MPIRKYIDDSISPEIALAMTDAFASACRTLKERGLNNISTQAIATKIAALAYAGESDPKRLTDQALAEVLRRAKES